ncbi:signal peptidase I [Motiliproteus sp. MSK22-1]|uniref:signal peptidase I n=1 Tax=Motiliproteus sp. MSK22-1 TaxID=1897630 RepID=UPI000976B4DD|nr:signal peptidase I [Motiliproteus sp. MSK22-1]OMH38123.1 signal peptidase I [Motiliproteus sp. MSK22-1]
MDIDFALVLVILVAVTGLVWVFDSFSLAPKRRLALQAAEAQSGGDLSENVKTELTREPVVVEYSKSFFPVLFLVLALRSFLVEPFQIPSGSMLPTLQIGDFILVNKYHYGIRLPVIGTKIVSINDPQRGDVMVFKYPKDPSVNYIKRVVGLPGDHIRYTDKMLYINGEPMGQEFMAKLPANRPRVELAFEQLGNAKHQIYKNLTPARIWDEWVVPEGHYFMMGDNRDNSNDSRFWGMVPDSLVVGKAFAIWMHWESKLSLPSFRNNGVIE